MNDDDDVVLSVLPNNNHITTTYSSLAAAVAQLETNLIDLETSIGLDCFNTEVTTTTTVDLIQPPGPFHGHDHALNTQQQQLLLGEIHRHTLDDSDRIKKLTAMRRRWRRPEGDSEGMSAAVVVKKVPGVSLFLHVTIAPHPPTHRHRERVVAVVLVYIKWRVFKLYFKLPSMVCAHGDVIYAHSRIS